MEKKRDTLQRATFVFRRVLVRNFPAETASSVHIVLL